MEDGSPAAAPPPAPPPEPEPAAGADVEAHLETMRAMGFADDARNRQALQAAEGTVEAAIGLVLNM